jgi:hypothetical protein
VSRSVEIGLPRAEDDDILALAFRTGGEACDLEALRDAFTPIPI